MQISVVLSKVKNLALEPAKSDTLQYGFEEEPGSEKAGAETSQALTSQELTGQELTDQERINWLRLIRSNKIGPITFYELIKRFGTAELALEAIPDLIKKAGGHKSGKHGFRIYPLSDAEREYAKAQRMGIRLVAYNEPSYPKMLANIDAPPPLLYMKGDISVLKQPVISIVGSRNGSAAGRQFTKQIASALGQLGYAVASGLARGIDTAAHQASLNTGTIAVVAGGVDINYPPENTELQARIGEKGLLISENAPGFRPRGKDFPRRNRIISGLSQAVLVIEAALRSGSLITARYALEHNRELFAAPGNPLDPRAEGTNKLIKQGANLLTHPDDVTEVLAPMLRSLPLYMKTDSDNKSSSLSNSKAYENLGDKDRQKILLALGPTPTDIDELIRSTELPAAFVHMVLLELDLAGRIERHGQQQVSLISTTRQGTLF